jgi:hypothetical protein
MEIDHFINENPESQYTFNPKDILRENFTRVNIILKYLKQLKPEIRSEWAAAIEKRIIEDTKNFNTDYASMDIDELIKEQEDLLEFQSLVDPIIQFSFFKLKMPADYIPKEEETETNIYDWLRATNVLRYHRVKAFFDVMDREEGIKLWKDIVYKATEDQLKENDELHPPIKEMADMWLSYGKPENPTQDYVAVKFEDHKFVLRVNQCPVYDSVKHLEDREAVYLSYCWTGRPEEVLSNKSRRKFTPCTLYTSNHCIEFYWNNDVHPDAKPPTDRFWNELKEGMKSE